MPEMDGFK
jgi:CheY-like chemotaxis protein